MLFNLHVCLSMIIFVANLIEINSTQKTDSVNASSRPTERINGSTPITGQTTNGSTHTTPLPSPGFINLGGKQPASGDCFKQFAHLKQRFNWEQLEFYCQKWRSFNEVIFPNSTNETNVPFVFTENQKKYLNSLKIDINSTINVGYPKAVRKEYRAMTENERLLFIFAIRTLKIEKIDGVSKYDLIVLLRHPAFAPGAQVGAAFMPWHREYLRT